jgi:hypothetical protein
VKAQRTYVPCALALYPPPGTSPNLKLNYCNGAEVLPAEPLTE